MNAYEKFVNSSSVVSSQYIEIVEKIQSHQQQCCQMFEDFREVLKSSAATKVLPESVETAFSKLPESYRKVIKTALSGILRVQESGKPVLKSGKSETLICNIAETAENPFINGFCFELVKKPSQAKTPLEKLLTSMRGIDKLLAKVRNQLADEGVEVDEHTEAAFMQLSDAAAVLLNQFDEKRKG